ncbi:MAG: formylglycine-generating enzyme family protein [Planctomycetota bacterium]
MNIEVSLGFFLFFVPASKALFACQLAPAAGPAQTVETTPTGSGTHPDEEGLVPSGLPEGFVMVPAGEVELGITGKELEEIVDTNVRREDARDKYRKLLLRELGHEKRNVPAFYLSRYEVTNAQYEIFVRKFWPKYRFPFTWWKQEDQDKKRDEAHKEFEERWKDKEKPDGVRFEFKLEEFWEKNFEKCEWEVPEKLRDMPVGWVTYQEARDFCIWAGLRLPTSAEWQHGFGNDRYTWGKNWDDKVEVPKKVVAVGTSGFGVNSLGLCELMGNHWEWVDDGFDQLDGFNEEFSEYRNLLRKRRIEVKDLYTPVFDPSMRLAHGGCADSRGDEAPIVFRKQCRIPLIDSQHISMLGFRPAKSTVPALDTTALKARYELDVSTLLGHELDLPSPADRELMRKGKLLDYRQRGFERWDMKDGLIHAYQMVSVVPIKSVVALGEDGYPKSEKEWLGWCHSMDGAGRHGMPIAAIFHSKPIRFETRSTTGVKGELEVEPGIRYVFYRTEGLPEELHLAMLAGNIELRANKGQRKTKEQLDAEAAEKKAEEEADEKDEKKGKKKSKQQTESEAVKQAAKTWKEVVDRYEVPDSITKDYPKKKSPKEITIHPGGIKIPVDRDVLLIRDHRGQFLGWLPGDKALSIKRGRGVPTKLDVDPAKGKVEYESWVEFPGKKFIQFDLSFWMDPQELAKPWIYEAP